MIRETWKNAGKNHEREFFHSASWQNLVEWTWTRSGQDASRTYPIHDATFNVSALVTKNSSSIFTISHRFLYDPHGWAYRFTALISGFAPPPAPTSSWPASLEVSSGRRRIEGDNEKAPSR